MKSFLALFLFTALIGCTESKHAKSADEKPEPANPLPEKIEALKNLEIDSIDLHCFCYSDSLKGLQIDCNTLTRVTPASLIRPDSKINHLASKTRFRKFVSRVLTDHASGATVNGIDNRLIAVIHTKNQGRKTLAFWNDSTLCYQDTYLIHYKISTKTLLHEAFGMKYVHCSN